MRHWKLKISGVLGWSISRYLQKYNPQIAGSAEQGIHG